MGHTHKQHIARAHKPTHTAMQAHTPHTTHTTQHFTTLYLHLSTSHYNTSDFTFTTRLLSRQHCTTLHTQHTYSISHIRLRIRLRTQHIRQHFRPDMHNTLRLLNRDFYNCPNMYFSLYHSHCCFPRLLKYNPKI